MLGRPAFGDVNVAVARRSTRRPSARFRPSRLSRALAALRKFAGILGHVAPSPT
jgi:hypothetical protein